MNIGISELITIYMFASIIVKSRLHINIRKKGAFLFTKFWCVFILLSMFGVAYNYILLNQTSGTLSSMVFDLLSYFFILITCFSMEILIYNYEDINIEYILKRTFMYSSLGFILLFIISRYSKQFFGISLLYYNYFVPLATNPHHTAMYIAPLPFIGLMFVNRSKKINKIILLILVIWCIYLGLQTGSSKITLGFILGGAVFFAWSIFNRIHIKRNKIMVVTFIILLFTSLLAFNLNTISSYITRVFIELDAGGARQTIYTIGFEKSFESFIVGYGPGAHSEIGSRYIDAHQTLLTILLQSGIFGLLFFIKLCLKLIKKYSRNAYIMGAMSPIFVYALGGDIMRRLPIWIFAVLFYYYIEKPEGLNKLELKEIKAYE